MSDSKPPIFNNNEVLDNDNMNDNPPPAYSESISSSTTSLPPNSHLHHQFQSLIIQITNTRLQNARNQSTQLQKSLTLLTAQIDPFFISLSTSGLTKGTLYLIPQGCISPQAKLADLDLRKDDELVELREVKSDGGKGGERVDLDYWRDEILARKLAKELEPKKEEQQRSKDGCGGSRLKPYTALSSTSTPSKNAETGRSSWWRKISDSSSSTVTPTPTTTSTSAPYQAQIETADMILHPTSKAWSQNGDVGKANVEMKVKAEEVVFRGENAFGLFTSERGWAIVMRFVVLLG